MTETMTGHCECGAVRYEAKAEPAFSAVCHCRHCQRAAGSASNPFIAVPKAAVKISGELRYFETKGDSGLPTRRGFCPSCGSRIFGMADIAPDLIAISVASLDDPSTFQPQMHVYTKSAQPWDRIHDDLPAFPAMPPMDGN